MSPASALPGADLPENGCPASPDLPVFLVPPGPGKAAEPDLETIDSAEIEGVDDVGRDPSLWLYRERTLGLLRRYMRLSIEVGRLPSLLGREFFRSRVTCYRMTTIEDAVIFVHDVDRALARLDELEKALVARLVLLEYTQDEVAASLGCGRRTIGRRFPEALDRLSEFFLAGGLLQRLPETSKREALETLDQIGTAEDENGPGDDH